MIAPHPAAALICAFLLGSVPFGVLVARVFYGVDIRASGSGNIGAANALRTLGKAGGAAVLLLDLIKGLIPVLAVRQADPHLTVLVAAAAVLGHCFSPWLRFKGGKGVATLLGALLALSWQAALVSAATWLLVVRLTRYSSIASMTACAVAAPALWLLTKNMTFALFAIGATAFILWTHRENIRRLREGRENALSLLNGART